MLHNPHGGGWATRSRRGRRATSQLSPAMPRWRTSTDKHLAELCRHRSRPAPALGRPPRLRRATVAAGWALTSEVSGSNALSRQSRGTGGRQRAPSDLAEGRYKALQKYGTSTARFRACCGRLTGHPRMDWSLRQGHGPASPERWCSTSATAPAPSAAPGHDPVVQQRWQQISASKPRRPPARVVRAVRAVSRPHRPRGAAGGVGGHERRQELFGENP